jgi:hypothetical protein
MSGSASGYHHDRLAAEYRLRRDIQELFCRRERIVRLRKKIVTGKRSLERALIERHLPLPAEAPCYAEVSNLRRVYSSVSIQETDSAKPARRSHCARR